MFNVGDVVFIDPNAHIDMLDGNRNLLINNGPFTIEDIMPEEDAYSWQKRNMLYIKLKEPMYWVNKYALIPVKEYKVKTPIERKIAHLYKLFDERKQ